MSHNTDNQPQTAQLPEFWEITSRTDQDQLRQFWLDVTSHTPLALLSLDAVKRYFRGDPVKPSDIDLAVQTAQRPSDAEWNNARGGEASLSVKRDSTHIYSTPETSDYIHTQARHNAHVANRTNRARTFLIPDLVSRQVDAETAFFALHKNTYGGGGIIPALRYESASFISRLAVEGSVEHLAGTYRKINVAAGRDFMHPTAEIVVGLSHRFFQIVDRVIPPSGLLSESLSSGGPSAIMQALTNIEFMIKLLHPPTDGSGRTSEDFYLFVASRIPGFHAPQISTNPYRDNANMQSRRQMQDAMRDELANRVCEILGIPEGLRSRNLPDSIQKGYNVPYNAHKPQGSALTNAERVLALMDVGFYYAIEELLNKLEASPGEPILPSAASAASQLDALPRTYDTVDNTKRAYVDYLVALMSALQRTNNDEVVIRRTMSVVRKTMEPKNRTPFTEALAFNAIQAMRQKVAFPSPQSMEIVRLGLRLLESKALTGNQAHDAYYALELENYRRNLEAQEHLLRSASQSTPVQDTES